MRRPPAQSLRRITLVCPLLASLLALSYYANLSYNASDPEPIPKLILSQQNHTADTVSPFLYRTDGLLEVNSDYPHPIYELIDKAKTSWEEKLARQSKSLPEACIEYKRRYGRDPPPGFDKWWEYVIQHNVQLPDEYDFLHRNLEIFWGVSPASMERRRHKWIVNRHGTFTLAKGQQSADVEITTMHPQANGDWTNAKWRANQQLDLLKDVGRHLPPFNATFYAEDVPTQFFSYEAKDLARNAAQSKGELGDIPSPPPYLGWAGACSPNSSLRWNNEWTKHPSPAQFHQAEPKTFIHDYLNPMDPCLHWHLVHFVGYLSNHGKGPSASATLFPTFAISSDLLHADILAVSPEGWSETVGHDPTWEKKNNARLFWRGSNTGAYHAEKNPWHLSHRIRLMSQSIDDDTTFEVLSPTPKNMPVGKPKRFPGRVLNHRLLDLNFVRKPIQCEPQVCAQLRSKFEFRGFVSQEEANQHKYLLDIDGNAWSARFKRLMSTNSCILKSTMFPEWYADRIQPWLHYAPVKVDLSDLYDILTFFRGEDDWSNNNDALGASIGKAGKEWSQNFYRKEDMTAYMFRLYLEYARLMNPERESLSFTDF